MVTQPHGRVFSALKLHNLWCLSTHVSMLIHRTATRNCLSTTPSALAQNQLPTKKHFCTDRVNSGFYPKQLCTIQCSWLLAVVKGICAVYSVLTSKVSLRLTLANAASWDIHVDSTHFESAMGATEGNVLYVRCALPGDINRGSMIWTYNAFVWNRSTAILPSRIKRRGLTRLAL